jgi:hypothetical protein
VTKNELIALDFGCMKITNEFYVPYFELIDPQVIDNAELFREKLNWKYLDLTILKKKSSTSLPLL